MPLLGVLVLHIDYVFQGPVAFDELGDRNSEVLVWQVQGE